MKALFCNNCKKIIVAPKMLSNIKMGEGAKITLKCSDTKCKGSVKIKSK